MRELPVQKLLILPVLIIAFLIRLQDFGKVFSSIVVFRGFDPYYHMRVVELILKTGSRPERDYLLNYPHGNPINVPPLFQYVIAAPGYIFGFEAAEVFAAFLPVILGVVCVLLVYLIAKKIFENDYYAALSALFFALSPGIIHLSSLGFTDYHIWSLTMILAATYFALNKNYYILLSGLFLAMLAFSWNGAPVYAAILALSLFIYRNDERELQLTSAAFAIPMISFVMSSFMAFAFLVLAIFLFVGVFAKKRGYTYHYLGLCLAIILIIYLIPSEQLPVLENEFSRLKHGIDYILGRSVTLPIIIEAQSFNLYGIIENAGYFVFILALPALAWRNKFLVSWFAIAFVLALFQIRFTDILIVAVTLLAGFTVVELLQRSGYSLHEEEKEEQNRKSKVKNKSKKKDKKSEEPTTKGDIAFIGVLIGFILVPSLVFSAIPFEMSDDWKEALLWMKGNTEDVNYLSPGVKPEYSVLSWEEYGNWIFYVAKRPTVSTAGPGDIVGTAKFFTAQNESEGLDFVQEKQIRYIMTSDEIGLGSETKGGKFGSIMMVLGMDPNMMGRNETIDFYNKSLFYELHVENATELRHFELEKNFGTVKVFRTTY